MAKYRTIQPEFWSDPYIEELSAYGKLLYLYLFTSQYTTNTGTLKVTTRKIAFETGITVEDVESALSGFERDGKIVRDGALIWVVNFIKNQTNTSPKIVIGLLGEIQEIASKKILSAIRAKYPQLFKRPQEKADTHTLSEEKEEKKKDIDTLSIPYPYPTDTTCIPSGEKEYELEDELESESECEKGSICVPNGTRADKPKKPPLICPVEQIVKAYSAILPGLLPVQRITDARKKAVQARWREDKERQCLAWWNDYFERVRASDFLMGRCPPTQGRATAWQADFDWLLKPGNMQKVIEGKYDNHARAAPEVPSYADLARKYGDILGLSFDDVENAQAVEADAEEVVI